MQEAINFANQGELSSAEKVCRDILAANDQFHPAYYLLGQISFQSGKDDVATQMFHKAALLNQTHAPYHRDLAEAIFFGGKPNEALAIINQALALNHRDPKSHYIAGMSMMTLGAVDKAMGAFETTVKLAPNHGAAYNNMGVLYEGRGQPKKAKIAYSKAVDINPKDAKAHNNLASIMIADGNVADAIIHIDAAINAQPFMIEAHHNLSALKTYKKGDKHIELLKNIERNSSKLPPENQIRLWFILGKVHSDLEEYDKAFEYYTLGNNQKRASFKYNEDEAIKFTQDIKSVFNKPYFKDCKKNKLDDLTPIFIVGMPRSGSTLIEQILSSHSDVHSGGELLTLNEAIKSIVKNFPIDIENLSDHELKMIGDDYLAKIRKLSPNAKRIINKMPSNYHYAGLIAKILPGAHIINTNRNPMDCCLSNYTHLFLHTIQYAYDLGELGRYYNRYQTLMQHWHSVLPKGVLLDIQYEDVVDDLEQEARKIIDFVGLEWQENCLNFHKNKSRVKTASAAQVRKIIYKSSIEKWLVFEKHLSPLKDALVL
jgi:Flp pilus assembly protein TadD